MAAVASAKRLKYRNYDNGFSLSFSVLDSAGELFDLLLGCRHALFGRAASCRHTCGQGQQSEDSVDGVFAPRSAQDSDPRFAFDPNGNRFCQCNESATCGVGTSFSCIGAEQRCWPDLGPLLSYWSGAMADAPDELRRSSEEQQQQLFDDMRAAMSPPLRRNTSIPVP